MGPPDAWSVWGRRRRRQRRQREHEDEDEDQGGGRMRTGQGRGRGRAFDHSRPTTTQSQGKGTGPHSAAAHCSAAHIDKHILLLPPPPAQCHRGLRVEMFASLPSFTTACRSSARPCAPPLCAIAGAGRVHVTGPRFTRSADSPAAVQGTAAAAAAAFVKQWRVFACIFRLCGRTRRRRRVVAEALAHHDGFRAAGARAPDLVVVRRE